MREQLTKPEFLARYVLPFERADWMYLDGIGWIVWRRGTGGNCELLHVRAFHPGMGHGRVLVRKMLNALAADGELAPAGAEPFPYHSVYGFTHVGNEAAQAFYAALGFHLQRLDGLYAAGEAILFWAPFADLLERMKQ